MSASIGSSIYWRNTAPWSAAIGSRKRSVRRARKFGD
jgi:hypothetical protein